MLNDNEILAIVGQEVFDARGFDSDELGANREAALNYYQGKPRGDEVEGHSEVQSLDVADHVNATMAQLAPMLKATQVVFKPMGPDDEDQAQAESDVVKQIAEDSGAYSVFTDAAFDALLQKNGWVKCYVGEEVETWVDEYENIPADQVGSITAPLNDNDTVEILSYNQLENTNYDLTVKHTVSTRELKIESVAPEYMIYAEGHKSTDISDCRFVAERMLMTKTEMREAGISESIIKDIPTVSYDTWTQSEARTLPGDSEHVGGQEDATYVAEVYDCYLHIDIDEDGIAELWRIRVAGYDANILLDKEQARFIPYCTGSARPMPHRVAGTSLFDALKFVQDSKTMTLRQLLDNQATGNNVRVGVVEGEANLDDVLESKPGGVIRMRSEGAIFPIPFNDVGGTCIQTLDYLDQVATARAGAAKDFTEGEFQIAGASATAAAGEIGHKEKMSAFFARNIIESIVGGAYMLIHKALRGYMGSAVQVQVRGEWVNSDPRRWAPRKHMRVIAGLSAAERREKAAALGMNLQYQQLAMQAGFDGTLVSAEQIHNTLSDWLRMNDLDDVSSYYIDPASEQAQQAAQVKQRQQQEAQEAQERLQTQLAEMPLQLDKYKADQEDRYKRWSDRLDAAVEEMKITGQGIADMELQALKNEEAAATPEAAA
jgi:hypothetical protein